MRFLLAGAMLLAAGACGGSTDLFGTAGKDPGSGGASGSGSGSGAGSAAATGTGSGGAPSSAMSSSAMSSTAMSSSAMSSSAMSSSAMSSTGSGLNPCGNGKIDMGETCDDGNMLANDGCSASCQLEGAGDKCPTGAIIKLSGSIVISDTTANKKNFTTTDCGGNSAPDVIYQVLPQSTGTVTVTLVAPGFDRILAIRTECANPNAAIDCLDGSATLSVAINAQKGVPFYVVVSGHFGAFGPFTLTITY